MKRKESKHKKLERKRSKHKEAEHKKSGHEPGITEPGHLSRKDKKRRSKDQKK